MSTSTSTIAATGPDATPEPTPRSHRVSTAVTVVLGAVSLGVVYGLVPFAVRASVIWFIALGRIDCGTDSLRSAASSYCPDVGGDLGGLFATNIPVIFGSTVVSTATGLPAEWSYSLVSVCVLAVGILGTYLLARRLGVRHWLALATALAYCASPSVLGVLGFGGMLYGAMALPVLVVVVLRTLDLLRERSRWAALGVVAWTLLAVSMLFADGYTFMMACLVTGFVVLVHVWGRWLQLASWLAVGALGVATAVSFLLYRAVMPTAGAWRVDELENFRAFGLDVSTLLYPSTEVWWAEDRHFAIGPSDLWGDGSNAIYNTMGVVFVGLALLALVRHPRPSRRLVVALALAGSAALVLALGPALKIAAGFDPSLSPAATAMPEGAGLLELPTAWISQNLPGFEFMRAVYRWVLVTRLVVILLAAVSVEMLLRRRRTGLAVALAVLAVVEVWYNPIGALRHNVDRAAMVREVERDVERPLDAALPDGERVVFVSGTERANDYLSVFLAPRADIRSWNIGNDKALSRARTGWPKDIDYLIAGRPEGREMLDASARMFEQDRMDSIVVLSLDLRNSAKSWPPSETLVERGESRAASYASDPRFTVEPFAFFSVVRPAS